ncbi:blue-light photoreceptor PHR2 [Magnolia sinica]|uniref:blue-light photoreceptor PHR2 n=1 Tax=Magnolia sinica TaxID=86752 RepID=UPI00265A8A33|nr:blue-light photoreceptor PHR2 [Magnolia sinica]
MDLSPLPLQPQPQEEQKPEPEHEITILPSPLLSTASLSLSLSSLLSYKPPSFLPHFSYKCPKIPSQISSVSSNLSPPKPSPSLRSSTFKSSPSIIPLQSPLSVPHRRVPDPSNPFALRRSSIVFFRNDLRLHDNETLKSAHDESLSVLPVYVFDPRDYGKSSSGFDKTGPYRATFLLQSVSDLRHSLRSRGSDLVVRIGRPETVLAEMARAVGAEAVYMQREVSKDEVRTEERIESALKEDGVEVKYFWGSTLYHLDDLPFKLEDMPSNFGGFRERVEGLEVRKTIEALDQLRGLPRRGDVEVGEIPSLVDLGLSPTVTMAQDGKPTANASLVGGETEALQRLQTFAAECRAQPNKGDKDSGRDNIYGANFSCKISPWLAMGCLSPRFMFDELKKSATRMVSATSTSKNGTGRVDNGMNWLMFELLWRDFFRFITKKYSAAPKKLEATPATACMGALA